MRYAVHDRDGWPLAMLGFSTAAWKLAPRDRFIGWTPQLREKSLPLVVDNPRFLILPWITIPNLVLFRTLFDGGFPRLFRAVDAQMSHIILALPDRGTAFDGAFPARLMKARGDRFARLVGM